MFQPYYINVFFFFFFFSNFKFSFLHKSKKIILLTGGAGYIGSHTALELLRSGYYRVIVIDNLSNSSKKSLDRISKLTNSSIEFHKVDLLDYSAICKVFSKYQISPNMSRIFAIIHFAGLKSVSESWENSLQYYENNIVGTINLLKAMENYGKINRIIFSSSATVYGDGKGFPVTEDDLTNPMNPYARTKFFIEQILKDSSQSKLNLNYMILRYFNPVGNDITGAIGENAQGTPNNLMPYVALVASGKYPFLNIFGNDYDTPDGTAIRDFIHVTDLALGHISSLKKMEENNSKNMKTNYVLNLGTGKGSSVTEIVSTFSSVNKINIPVKICDRRKGDIMFSVANASLAETILNWKAIFNLRDMCKDLWTWHINNPAGFNETMNE